MKDVHSPSPQPEDPNRVLDTGLEEDQDTFVELVDMTFYQLSCDGVMVAIDHSRLSWPTPCIPSK